MPKRLTSRKHLKQAEIEPTGQAQMCDENDTNVSLPCVENETDATDTIPSSVSLKNLIPGAHKRITPSRDIEAYSKLSLDKRREILRDDWGQVAYTLLGQAKRHAPHFTKKDYGRLMQLVTTAGIAYDKFVPKDTVASSSAALILNLFHGMDKQAVGKVIGNVVDATIVEDSVTASTPVSDSAPK